MSDTTPIQTLQQDPPCPRVNTWADGYPPGPFLTEAGYFELTQPPDATASGIDIFFWKYRAPQTISGPGNITTIPGRKGQVCEFSASGNYTFTESDAGENLDQTKYQIRYTEPGNYFINIRIYNTDETIPQPSLLQSTLKSIRLGDKIAAATSAIGIKPCSSCKKRQAILNGETPDQPDTLTINGEN